MIRVRFGVNSKGENVTFNSNSLFFNIINRFGGHSVGVIPGLVSIPVVKSFCVLFVYYGFLWEFHFAASLFIYKSFDLLLFNLSLS